MLFTHSQTKKKEPDYITGISRDPLIYNKLY